VNAPHIRLVEAAVIGCAVLMVLVLAALAAAAWSVPP
jgi:hypothetical protein